MLLLETDVFCDSWSSPWFQLFSVKIIRKMGELVATVIISIGGECGSVKDCSVLAFVSDLHDEDYRIVCDRNDHHLVSDIIV